MLKSNLEISLGKLGPGCPGTCRLLLGVIESRGVEVFLSNHTKSGVAAKSDSLPQKEVKEMFKSFGLHAECLRYILEQREAGRL
jgi:hypothetical protein